MSTNLERELKLAAPQGFSLARLPRELKSFVASAARFQRLHTIYFDSGDLRLTRWNCSLRYRHGEGWTLKIPVFNNHDTLVREEHVFNGSADQPPQEALDLATAYLRGAPVRRVAELRTVRVKRELQSQDGKELADVVEDDVRVVDGARIEQRFQQLEIELEDGVDARIADAIGDALRDEGAGAPDPTPKSVMALRKNGIAPEVTVPSVAHDSCVEDVIRAALGRSTIQLLRNDAKMRLGNDAEAVHQARVAVRRLRSDLRTFLRLLETSWARDLRERLSWLQDRLSPVRDTDVLAERLAKFAEELPPGDALHASRIVLDLRERLKREHAALREALQEPRYRALLEDLVAAAARPRFTGAPDAPGATVAPSLLRSAYKKVRKAVRRAGLPPGDRDLHRIRIKAKHLRYAAEALADATGKPAAKLAREAERLQTLLGDQHDAVVMVRRLREAGGETETVFAAGELAMLFLQKANAARRKWRRQWKRIRRAHGLID